MAITPKKTTLDFTETIQNFREASISASKKAKFLTYALVISIYLLASGVIIIVLYQTNPLLFLNSSELFAKLKSEGFTNFNVTDLVVIQRILLIASSTGFILYLMQIIMSFIRYYSQLSELYKAQANALIASNGDPEIAYQFITHFSPLRIPIGRMPTTLYEKALDTMTDLARKIPPK